MVDMTNPEYVQGLKSNCHAVFDTAAGQEVMRFLEISCCWYQSVLSPLGPEMTQVNDGKRQVVATLKTILELNPDQIVSLAQQRKEGVQNAG